MIDKFTSCIHLREHLLFGQNFLGFCCNMPPKHWFQAINNYRGEFFPAVEFINQRQRMEDALNSGQDCTCRGCLNLVRKVWSKPRALVTMINFGHTYACNLRCVYCYYNKEDKLNLRADYYDVVPVVKNMYERDLIAADAEICLASGEPLFMRGIDELISLILNRSKTVLEVRSNFTVYSEPLAEAMRRNRAKVCVSLDSGTRETFKVIKGRDLFRQVTANFRRYAAVNPDAVEFKYICRPENLTVKDRRGALRLMEETGVRRVHLTPDHLSRPGDEIFDFIGCFAWLAERQGVTVFIDYDNTRNFYPDLPMRNKVETAYSKSSGPGRLLLKKMKKTATALTTKIRSRLNLVPKDRRTLSCRHLRSHLVFRPDGSIGSCCVTNDYQLILIESYFGGPVPDTEISAIRNKIKHDLGAGRETTCTGCPKLENLPSDSSYDYFCDRLNLGCATACNLSCMYCVDNIRGLTAASAGGHDMLPIVKDLYDRNLLSPNAEIYISGGEPFLVLNIDQIIDTVMNRSRSFIEIRSNLTVFSEAAVQAISAGRLNICFSLDSGTPETFKKIKGRDMFAQVVANAHRYAAVDPYCLILKYICLPENCSEADMAGVLELLKLVLKRLRLAFDMYHQPSRVVMEFAGRFKALAELAGSEVTVDYDLAESYKVADGLRRTVELSYRNTLQHSRNQPCTHIHTKKMHKLNAPPPPGACGYVEAVERREDGGLVVRGWAFDRESGRLPDEILVFRHSQLIFAGRTHYVRDDVATGIRAGFYFYSGDDAFARQVLNANIDTVNVYAGFGIDEWYTLARV
jgi:molybdenum cofactor biosynthesis enzyme MoaA